MENSETSASYDLAPPSIPLFEDDSLLRKGKEFASGLLPTSSQGEENIRYKKMAQYAEAQVDRAIADGNIISDHQIDTLQLRWQTEQGQVPHWENARNDAQKVVSELEQERGLLGEEPKRPKIGIFLFCGALLGLIFGVIGATTVGDIIFSMFGSDDGSNRDLLFSLGMGISVMIGLIIGTVTIMIREYAIGGSFFIRWAPTLSGMLFALGLGGYRLMQPTEHGVSIHLSSIGIVLTFLELAILLAIEFNDMVLLNAWERWDKGRSEISCKEEQMRRAESELQRRESKYLKELQEADDAQKALYEAHHKKNMASIIKIERDHYIQHCLAIMRNGFDVELDRIKKQH